MASASTVSPELTKALEAAAATLRASGHFERVDVHPAAIEATPTSNEEAAFRVQAEGDGLVVAWLSANRYLSQSIEADLMWTGDDLNDLIDEEVAEAGYTGPELGRVEHFRDEQKRFTFRSKLALLPSKATAQQIASLVLGYHAAFAELGDMKPGEDE